MIIRENDKLTILNIAENTIKTPSQIWAFGSRVDGSAHDMSDLDLVIVPNDEKKLPISELTDFKDTLQESNTPIIVQVMDWNRIPKTFHANILNNYEIIKEIT